MNQMMFNTPGQPLPSQNMQPEAVGNRFARDLTDMDLSSHLGSVASNGAGGLNIQFFYARVRVKSRNAQTNGQLQTRLCVAKQPKGDRFTIAVRFVSEDEAQRLFPREFAAFKQYEDVPTSGTPLSELPGISQSQIGMLVINGLRSIEDLATISDDAVGQLGFEVIAAQRLAKAWVARRDGADEAIKAAEAEARARLEREEFNRRFAAVEALVRQLEAENAVLRRAQGVPASVSPGVVEVEGDGDLPYELGDMPDLIEDGPLEAVGNDDLNDPDPLRG